MPSPFSGAYLGRRVLVTGHTGFKGAWICEWLLAMGAEVSGLALAPATEPALFDQLELSWRLDHRIGDIRDPHAVSDTMRSIEPDFVFHLAAQPLVRDSFNLPVDTYQTNVMGTINLMEALRSVTKPCAAVLITTDKCYANREWAFGYREDDPLGGVDPYSSSKAACEIAVASWRGSFFAEGPVGIATARAGNVIGGGDWSKDRIVPDLVRSIIGGSSIRVRHKAATRPWQHVLEPLSGYLHLGALLYIAATSPMTPAAANLRGAYNFGPGTDSSRSVEDLVVTVLKRWPGSWEEHSDPASVHEAQRLSLATDKAFNYLRWRPVWSFDESVARTVEWYRSNAAGGEARALTSRDISDYVAAARNAGVSWAV